MVIKNKSDFKKLSKKTRLENTIFMTVYMWFFIKNLFKVSL